jgi:molybdenum ABC transporter molybdate-binding protein
MIGRALLNELFLRVRGRLGLLVLLLLFYGSAASLGDEQSILRVAVAANFADVMQDIATDFSAQSDFRVEVVTGSTGKLYAQIRHGAPFDVFLAADTERPLRLIQEGLAEPESYRIYAEGRLALWMPGQAMPQLSLLRDSSIRHIALGNPDLAPYGKAAVEALMHSGLDDQTRSKWVFGESVVGAQTLVATGNAQAGLLALSSLRQAGVPEQNILIVPSSSYQPIAQGGVAIVRSNGVHEGALALLAFLQTSAVRTNLEAAGYTVPIP